MGLGITACGFVRVYKDSNTDIGFLSREDSRKINIHDATRKLYRTLASY